MFSDQDRVRVEYTDNTGNRISERGTVWFSSKELTVVAVDSGGAVPIVFGDPDVKIEKITARPPEARFVPRYQIGARVHVRISDPGDDVVEYDGVISHISASGDVAMYGVKADFKPPFDAPGIVDDSNLQPSDKPLPVRRQDWKVGDIARALFFGPHGITDEYGRIEKIDDRGVTLLAEHAAPGKVLTLLQCSIQEIYDANGYVFTEPELPEGMLEASMNELNREGPAGAMMRELAEMFARNPERAPSPKSRGVTSANATEPVIEFPQPNGFPAGFGDFGELDALGDPGDVYFPPENLEEALEEIAIHHDIIDDHDIELEGISSEVEEIKAKISHLDRKVGDVIAADADRQQFRDDRVADGTDYESRIAALEVRTGIRPVPPDADSGTVGDIGALLSAKITLTETAPGKFNLNVAGNRGMTVRELRHLAGMFAEKASEVEGKVRAA